MDNPNHPDPSQELPPPPEEKLLPSSVLAKKHEKLKMIAFFIILAIIMEVVSIYFLKTDNDVKFLQSFFENSKTSVKPTPVNAMPTVVQSTPIFTPQPSPVPTETSNSPISTESGTICTNDVMQCPDGTYVGRVGPKCEFLCPSARH